MWGFGGHYLAPHNHHLNLWFNAIWHTPSSVFLTTGLCFMQAGILTSQVRKSESKRTSLWFSLWRMAEVQPESTNLNHKSHSCPGVQQGYNLVGLWVSSEVFYFNYFKFQDHRLKLHTCLFCIPWWTPLISTSYCVPELLWLSLQWPWCQLN